MSDKVEIVRSKRLAEARANVDEARGAAFNVMDKLYANPRRALDGMQAFAKKYGDDALVKKLEGDAAYFGTTRGHLGSETALSLKGFKDRAVSKDLSTKIPSLVNAALAAENKLLDMERGYSGKGPSGPEPGKGGKGGMDF